MDRELALKHLVQAEAAVARGLQHIAEQQLRIARRWGDAHDAAEAKQLLRTFLDLQRSHEEHRDRLRAELTETPRVGADRVA